jgi:uncharacterized lipoprotein YmbA
MRRATFVLACCCACSLGGKPPAYDYFVLTPSPSQTRVAQATDEHPTLGVSLVTIPGYLDREQIATRTNDYSVMYSSHDRWAEPLDVAFERTLKHDLAVTLAPEGITLPTRAGAPTYDVQVDVLRFERFGTDHVELWARWSLRSETRLVHAGDTRVRLAVDNASNAAAAAALSQTLLHLADDIAKQVRLEVARRSTPTAPDRGRAPSAASR